MHHDVSVRNSSKGKEVRLGQSSPQGRWPGIMTEKDHHQRVEVVSFCYSCELYNMASKSIGTVRVQDRVYR